MHDVWVRWLALSLLVACHGSSPATPAADAVPGQADAPPAPAIDATPADAPPVDPTVLAGIYNEVDATHLVQLLQDMGVERYDDTGRANFRAYWTTYMTGLGLPVRELDYQAASSSRPGVDLEATLVGPSADSFIVIVHYDSMGPPGQETTNPGVDDDMTGMAIEMETARILVAHASQLGVTVRFVAADEEELGDLAGARAYAADIKAKATAGGFKLIGAVDDEQSGWNCNAVNGCFTNSTWPDFDIYSCGSGGGQHFNYQAMGNAFEQIATTYSPLHVTRGCSGREQRSLRDVGDRRADAGVLRGRPVRQPALRPGGRRHVRPDRPGLLRVDRARRDHVPGVARVALTLARARERVCSVRRALREPI